MVRNLLASRCKCLPAARLVGAVACGALSLGASDLLAQYNPAAGYVKTELVDSSSQSLSVQSIGVSAGGALATFNDSTLTLYNTWKNGRSEQFAPISNSAWTFTTDLTFIGENKVVFGENSTNTIWVVDFSNPASPTTTRYGKPKDPATEFSGSFPGIQGVATVNPSTVLISGTTAAFGDTGGLYLEKLDLASNPANPSISPVVQNTGTGFVGGSGVSTAGSGVLLDTGDTDPFARVYDLTTLNSIKNINLTPGGGFGAYGIATDIADDAFVTTGNTLTEITGIDSDNPGVSQFGFFSEGFNAFPTGIVFTGGSFLPGDGAQSGALIVNGGFTNDGGLFAITSVPEPKAIGLMLFTATGAMGLRRRNVKAEVVRE